MKLLKKGALFLNILGATALTACQATQLQYQTPELNEKDRKRFKCDPYPNLESALEALPDQRFLSTSDGKSVETPDGHKWVRFDIANQREALLIRYGGVEGKRAHFVCKNNLQWLSGVWKDLENPDP